MIHLTPIMPSIPLSLYAVTLSIIFLPIFFFKKWMKRDPSSTSPPSPPRLPIIGNLHQLGSLPHRGLRALSAKYGPLMLLHFGQVPTIVVSSSELAREVMKTHDLIFASRPPMSAGERIFYGSSDIAFSPYGEYWRQTRRISVLHLLSVKMVQSFQSVRAEEASLFLEKIRESSHTKDDGLVNLSMMIVDHTNNIISRVALGKKYKEEGAADGYNFREMMRELVALLGLFPIKDFIRWLGWLDWLSGLDSRMTKISTQFDGFLEGVMEEHRVDEVHGNIKANNFVDVLVSLRYGDENSGGFTLSRDNIKALILDMFAAGTDTVSTAIEWTMAELIKNPDVMNRVQEEVRGALGCKTNIEMEDINKMHYLKATIKEALRLHSPIPLLVPRQTTKDVQLQGYEIVTGTRVVINAWAIGRDPTSWDRAEEFYPDRFMNSDIDVKGLDFELIPFGAGRRGCPGTGFALATIEHTLASLLQHFDWELPGGMKGEGLDMSESFGIAVRRKINLHLVAKPHDS